MLANIKILLINYISSLKAMGNKFRGGAIHPGSPLTAYLYIAEPVYKLGYGHETGH